MGVLLCVSGDDGSVRELSQCERAGRGYDEITASDTAAGNGSAAGENDPDTAF